MDLDAPYFDQAMATDSQDWLNDRPLARHCEDRDGAGQLENTPAMVTTTILNLTSGENRGHENAYGMDLKYTLSGFSPPTRHNTDQIPRSFNNETFSFQKSEFPMATEKDDLDYLPDNIDTDDAWSVPPTSSFGTQGGEPDSSPLKTNESGAITSELFEDEAPREYQLRPQSRSAKSLFSSTWIDRDETGIYGESKTRDELRQEKERRERDARRRQARIDAAADELIDGEADDEGRPRLIPTLPVVLTFHSPTRKQRLRNFFATCKPSKAANAGETSEGYPLRRRRSAKTSRYHTDWSFGESRSTSDPGDDLTGHPSARGCYECLSLGLRCSLLDNEEAWPCHACTEDDHDCELITAPTVKRACERCKSSRTGCSFSYDIEQGVACQQCMEDGHRCIAGPAKESIRPRLSYDWDWENDPVLKRKALKLIEDPLAFRVRRERPLLVSEPVVHKKLQTHERVQADDDSAVGLDSKRSGKKQKIDRTNGQRGTTKTITTKFCHPIKFNHIDKTNGKEQCHCCAEPGFALLGHPAKEVEVIEWKDGKGLEEVSGGYAGEGLENTRICASCTVARLPIIMCQVRTARRTRNSLILTSGRNTNLLQSLASPTVSTATLQS